MQINLRQIPVTAKVFRNYFMSIPVDFRKSLGWKEGDTLEIFGIPEGIFIRKREEK